MFHIYCPYCEEHREEEEFHPKGQAHIARPDDPDACSDEEWEKVLWFRRWLQFRMPFEMLLGFEYAGFP